MQMQHAKFWTLNNTSDVLYLIKCMSGRDPKEIWGLPNTSGKTMFDVSRYQPPGQLKIAEGLLSRKKDALLPVGIHGDFKKDRSGTEPDFSPLVPKPWISL